MTTTIETSFFIRDALLQQVDSVAQELNISRNEVFELAFEQFIAHSQSRLVPGQVKPDAGTNEQNVDVRIVNQGDVYWVRLEGVNGEEADIPHPYVVVQDNLFNHSRIKTVVVCALTSNIKRSSIPGNVAIEVGEANLPKQSVVEVSKISSVDKTQLGEYMGTLSEERIHQILAGMRFLQRSFFKA